MHKPIDKYFISIRMLNRCMFKLPDIHVCINKHTMFKASFIEQRLIFFQRLIIAFTRILT